MVNHFHYVKKKSPLLIIFLTVFIDLVGFGIVIPILPYYARTFGATAGTLGLLMASYSAMQFIFAPFWGSVSDRVGRRPVLLFSLLGSAIGLVILGSAQSLAWLFIGRIFSGICGGNISAATAYIADITTPENRAKGMGIIGASFGLGFIFGPAIGGVLSKYGYSAPMYFAAGIAFINVIYTYFSLPEPLNSVKDRSANRSKRFDKQTFRDVVLADPRVFSAVLIFFIITFAFTQVEVSFALFMLKRFNFGAEQSGWLMASMGLIGAIVQGGMIGRLAKRFGELSLILAGTALMTIGLGLFASATVMITLVIANVIVAIGNGLNNPSLSSLASQGAPANRRGATMGIYQSAGALARVFGPICGGYFFDRISESAPFYLAACLYGCAFLVGAYFFQQNARLSLLQSKAD